MRHYAARVLVSLFAAAVLAGRSDVTIAQSPSLTLWSQHADAAWTDWSMQGVRLVDAAVVLAPGSPDESVIQSGRLEGPVQEVLFDELIPSWNAHTPVGTWIETLARVRMQGEWTGWYSLGRWSSDGASGNRHSLKGQDDERVRILTDTLQVRGLAEAYQLSVTLHAVPGAGTPALMLMAAVATSGAAESHGSMSSLSIPASALEVPERSQMVYPNGGEVWCSPTSTSMVMAYWADVTADSSLNRPVPDVAAGTYDPVYRGNGNWPFNTAYAADAGLIAFVTRGASLQDVERWLAVGVPVIASLGWSPGELPEAPIGSTNGHLLVIVGVTQQGDVIVNDPAADPRRGQRVRRVYNRRAFESLWLSHSGGTMYVIYPTEHPVTI